MVICVDMSEEGARGWLMTPDGALPGAPGWPDAVKMDTSDLTSRGYGAVLWEPDQQTVHDARITRFMRWLALSIPGSTPGRGHDFGGYADLWQWSVTEPGSFW